MKPKIIFLLLLAGLVVLAFVVFRSKPSVKVPPASVGTAGNAAETSLPMGAVKPVIPPPASSAATTISPPLPARTVDELESLGMKHDADSLRAILAELTNSNPEIRAAARKAAVQFGDRAAAPALRAVAAKTEDVDEKRALLEAADFLELPPLEVRARTNAGTR